MNDAIRIRRELAELYRRRAETAWNGGGSHHRITLYHELADELETEATEIEEGGTDAN